MKNRIVEFPRLIILLFFISSVLLIPACGSQNDSLNDVLSEDLGEKIDHDHGGDDHGGHDHGGHDHHSSEDSNDLSSHSETPDVSFEVEILEGKVKGGLTRFEVSKGDVVEITVYSDKNDEVHLHVYDNVANIKPGTPATIIVDATIPGIFEAELHSAGFRIFELQVS